MQSNERFNYDWYQKRINQNSKIKQHLVEKIKQHADKSFPFDIDSLSHLNYEDLLEIAVATVNKQVGITLGTGSDLSNGADCKFSIVRTHNYGQTYSASIKTKNKKFIYACVYEGIQNKFYYFAFPAMVAEHSVPFDKQTGEPRLSSLRGGVNPMWTWKCDTFEEMATYNTGIKQQRKTNKFADLFDYS